MFVNNCCLVKSVNRKFKIYWSEKRVADNSGKKVFHSIVLLKYVLQIQWKTKEVPEIAVLFVKILFRV